MTATTTRNESPKREYLWVDVELLHWAAHPNLERQGAAGSFNLECLKLYISLSAEALRQMIRPKASDALIAAPTDPDLLRSLGFATPKGAVNLGILKRLGLVRQADISKKHDISYSVSTKAKAEKGETEQEARDYTEMRMYEDFVAKYGATTPEDFRKRYWSVRRCDGKPWNKNYPRTGVQQFVRLDWLLFKREHGKKSDEFMTLSPEEVFLMLLLHQGTRPFLTCGVHPTYIQRREDGKAIVGDMVRLMCAAAGFSSPVEDVLASLIARGYFTWISVPLASQDAGKGGGGMAERSNTQTVVANYDARYPENLTQPKKRTGESGTQEVIPPEEILEGMRRTVLAPTRGFYIGDKNEILSVLRNGEIDLYAEDDTGVGQLLFGRFPIPARSRAWE